jgi:hypothetical protein
VKPSSSALLAKAVYRRFAWDSPANAFFRFSVDLLMTVPLRFLILESRHINAVEAFELKRHGFYVADSQK